MSEAKLGKKRLKFYTERESIFVRAAAASLILSCIFRLIGSWGLWGDSYYLISCMLLPIAAALIFAALLIYMGKKLLSATLLPALMGFAFFVFRAACSDVWWQTAVMCALSLLGFCIYALTVLGYFSSKWPLCGFMTLPILIHIVYDVIALGSEAGADFKGGMRELSVLCILLGLLFTALAMKKAKPAIEEMELPKMKGPRVIKPSGKDKSAPEAEKAPAGEKKAEEEKKENTEAGE